MADYPITLTLTEDEAAAVSVALVGLIHDQAESGSPSVRRWQRDASKVADRLLTARDEAERG